MKNNPLTFIDCDANYETAKIVLFGAPFDGTTSYRPGTRFAPNEIRLASFGLETFSPYQNKDLMDLHVFDYGDLDLGFGNPQKIVKQITDFAKKTLNDSKIPFMIGGEHLVTLGNFQAVVAKYPDVCLLQFDAHADLRTEYMDESLSHACVMRRCYELLQPNSLYQFGIRSMTKEEYLFAKMHTFCNNFDLNNLDKALNQIKQRPIYLTIDLDVLDPSIFPGTGTPEAGGVSFEELRNALMSLKGLNIVGLDVNELSPHYDQSGVSTIVAAKIIRELLLLIG